MSAAEAQAGVLALASVWPSLELLARCGGADTARAQRAHSALRRIVAHAGYAGPDGFRVRVHEAGEFTLAKGLFGHSLEEPLLQAGFVSDLIVAAATHEPQAFCETHSADLRTIAARVREEEERLERQAATGRRLHPEASLPLGTPSGIDLAIVAAGLVQALAEEYGIPLDAANSNRAVNLVVQNFPVAMAFMFGLISDSSPKGDLPGGGNSAWDLKIAFHASRGGSIAGIPAILVSDDKRLLRAAREGGDERRVMPLQTYHDILSKPDEVAQLAEELRN